MSVIEHVIATWRYMTITERCTTPGRSTRRHVGAVSTCTMRVLAYGYHTIAWAAPAQIRTYTHAGRASITRDAPDVPREVQYIHHTQGSAHLMCGIVLHPRPTHARKCTCQACKRTRMPMDMRAACAGLRGESPAQWHRAQRASRPAAAEGKQRGMLASVCAHTLPGSPQAA